MTRVREGFRSHKTLSYDYRMQQLHNLQRLLVENEQRILGALKTDLNKVGRLSGEIVGILYIGQAVDVW